ncbi:family 16 glycosylhydrolase [Coraliomargarita akajimensis]|uniref:Glycoside hydrolase family 16 n=1 Tax=Coraliomargarita akajimensis (strain DSM 45221 / IAM 15411 / JCM 23193 / KCTC 12865 / 04OKA010-24) TaxID=583355 RepID=D5EKY6_CORAD|nr:family 16 glycosylhydrolase [Coraliomargarita akajimensis]ADE53088.1 glycoside hydrolase family 16 [Coraliomargarita akajimensis DSM 45221]
MLSRYLTCLIAIPTAVFAAPPEGADWVPVPAMTDEFDGTELDASKWYDHNPTWMGREPGYFSKDNVAVYDGKLHLTAKAEQLDDLPKGYHSFTTAAVKSKTLIQYGYFEIKAKAMDSHASSAFWFYNHQPEEWTEIDVFEISGGSPKKQRTYHMTVHVFITPEDGKKHWQNGTTWEAPFRFADDYHVYGLEWDAETIKWYVDGELVRVLKNTHWHQPLTMNFDSETFPHWFGLPDASELPATYSIEYVRAWQKKAEAAN